MCAGRGAHATDQRARERDGHAAHRRPSGGALGAGATPVVRGGGEGGAPTVDRSLRRGLRRCRRPCAPPRPARRGRRARQLLGVPPRADPRGGRVMSGKPQPRDVDLVERLCAGDPAALEELMEQFSGKVYRLAYGITRDSADAEEVVQDVFLTAFAKIKSFEARAALGTWIYRITTNVALNRRRGLLYEREVPLEECLPTFKADGHREGDRSFVLADWSGTPEEELMSAEGRRVLARAIESLPGHYRSVLVLRDVEGLSNEEVAEVV